MVICTKHHQEARNEEETFTHIHSTLPTVESGMCWLLYEPVELPSIVLPSHPLEDSSDEEEYEDDMVVDDDLQGDGSL